jgi:YbgC/YbaW family acyl-CoA thioester hydrolase
MELTPKSFYNIRFGDCDLFGHLNNARYLDYFINAREDHLKDTYDVHLSDYYKTGTGWVVGNHEIYYLRPAHYGERACIQTTLLKAADDHLLVEMLMMDEQQLHIKAMLWTRFVPVNVKTGKRENHPEQFMSFARSIENTQATNVSNGKERLQELITGLKLQLATRQ